MKRKTIILTAIATAAALALAGGYAYSVSSERPTVGVATATVADLSVSVSASGQLVAARSVGVYPPATGTLASVKVADGDRVKQGQPLAVMSKGALKLALAQAKAAHSAAEAQQEAVQNGVPSAIENSAAQLGLAAARSQVSTANQNYRSFRNAYHDASSAERKAMRSTLRTLRTAKATARASLGAAKASLSRLSISGRVSLARKAAAQSVTATSKALRIARENLDGATLRAPIAGTVRLNGTVEKGAGLTTGVAPFTVIDPSRMQFEANVFETDISAVAAKQPTSVTLDAFPESFTGSVVRIQSSPVTTTTGTVAFPVRISVKAGEQRLFQGMNGSAEISVETITDAVTVPIEAVLTQGSEKIVYLLGADDIVFVKKVEVGASTDTSAQILSGIAAGERVITTGAAALSEGQQVRPA